MKSSSSSELANWAEAQGLRVKGLFLEKETLEALLCPSFLEKLLYCTFVLLLLFFLLVLHIAALAHSVVHSTAQHRTLCGVNLRHFQAGCEWLNPVKYGLVSTAAAAAVVATIAPLGCTSWPVVVVTAGHFWLFSLSTQTAALLLFCTA